MSAPLPETAVPPSSAEVFTRPPSAPVAAVTELTVRYGSKTVLDSLSLEVPPGCVGLLGPNGAGKTTLIKTLLGFVPPVAGRGTVLGKDVAREPLAIRQRIGLMPEQDCHIPGLSAVQFVAYAGELSGMPSAEAMRRAHEVLEYCALGEARYRNVETYSTGMKQRIKLAQALVHGPKLLFLDEPTNGLDPQGRDEMLDLIRDVSHGKGISVIVSSHLLPDIERTCDAVIVMKSGRVVRQGPIDELRAVGVPQVEVELTAFIDGFAQAMERQGGSLAQRQGASVVFAFPGGLEKIGQKIWTAAKESGAQVRGFRSSQRRLEDVFLEAIDANEGEGVESAAA